MLKKIAKNKSGQSLIELIVAVAIIQVGLLSVWSLFLSNFNAERESELRIVGANLSREGIELVKNIRDSNWLRADRGDVNEEGTIWPWDEGLSSGVYSVSYDNGALEDEMYGQLYIDAQGFYTNSSVGTKISPYKRTIELKSVCCSDNDGNLVCDGTNYQIKESTEPCSLRIGINVIAKTTWSHSGSARSSVVEDIIYNWR
ncbi:MAG: hypothetical protein BWY53_00583 [Parcubacteria group bacterium ADurb.Bin326]|nr:MAG: hypothetical protein BWY53_00583 [Parcubacteria group bacterium ADurb.Bin326]